MTEQTDLRSFVGEAVDDPMGAINRLGMQLIEQFLGDEQSVQAVTGRLMGLINGATADEPPYHAQSLYDALVERTTVLAAALGACDCWGEMPDCPVCSGAGGAGWMTPDPVAFDVYVAPALEARKGTAA